MSKKREGDPTPYEPQIFVEEGTDMLELLHPEREVERLRAEVGRLRQALVWYADEKNWTHVVTTTTMGTSFGLVTASARPADNDRGACARAALAPPQPSGPLAHRDESEGE